MKKHIALFLIATAFTPIVDAQPARRDAQQGRGNAQGARSAPARVRPNVQPGFPIRRALPDVVVRQPRRVSVAPRVYLGPLVFGATIAASIPRGSRQLWQATETLSSSEGWTDFTMNVGRPGNRLYLKIDGGAQFSFAEVIYDDGQSQVVDFNDLSQGSGLYSLVDVAGSRTIDSVRMVAKANTRNTSITLRLIS